MEDKKPVKAKKKKLTKRGLAVIIAAAVIIVCAVLIPILKHDGNPRSRTTAALKIGNQEISCAEFGYYYYRAVQKAAEETPSQSAVSSGTGIPLAESSALDPQKDPAKQTCPYQDENGKTITWAEYLKKEAIESARYNTVFYTEAVKNGIMLNHYENETIDASIDWYGEAAENEGLTTEEYLQKTFGLGEDELRGIMEKEAIAAKYNGMLKTECIDSVTGEQLKAAFKANPALYSKAAVRCAFFPFPTLTQSNEETDDAFAKRREAEAARLLEVVQSIAKDISDRKSFDSVAAKYSKKDEKTGAVCTVYSACASADEIKENTDPAVCEWVCDESRKADQFTAVSGENGIYIVYIVKPMSGEHHSVTVRCCFKAVTGLGIVGARKDSTDLLSKWKADGGTLEGFAAMCRKNTDNEQINGEEMIIRAGDICSTVDDWCFNSERKPGDTAVLNAGDDGCYIVYFVSDNTDDLDWQQAARDAVGTGSFDSTCLELFESDEYKLKENKKNADKVIDFFCTAIADNSISI